MSELLKIKNIEKDFQIEPGNIYNLNIENQKFYYNLLDKLYDFDEDTFIYSKDYEIKNLSKSCLIIDNIFNLDANNKKILNSLYKRISSELIDKSDKDEIEKINSTIISLLNKISLDLNLNVDYYTDLDVIKILNLYNFCFKMDQSTPLEKFVTYIKANLEINKYKFIISTNILPLFSKSDIELLSNELKYLGLTLINITLIQQKYENLVDSLTIDNDLCEF